MTKIEDYLSHIDSRGPDSERSDEIIDGMGLVVGPLVWNPNKGKSTKLFIETLKEYPLDNIRSVLDVGTGCGILSVIVKNRGIEKVIAVDNMREAVENARENFKLAKQEDIEIRLSDLFSNVTEKFDLVLFNAPASHPLRKNISRILQPLWSNEDNIRLRFLDQLEAHLTENGKALLLDSKFVDYDPLPEETLVNYPFSFKVLKENNGELSETRVIEISKS